MGDNWKWIDLNRNKKNDLKQFGSEIRIMYNVVNNIA